MVNVSFGDRGGFSVLYNSTPWRTALHAWQEEVNGISALKEWGMHMDSEESFVLLCGSAVLASQDEEGRVTAVEMELYTQYVIGAGERHAVILREGARVFIAENRDMGNTKFVPMEKDALESIQKMF